MAINLLSTITQDEVKRERFKMNSIIWNVVLFVLYVVAAVGVFLYDGYLNTEKVNLEAKIKETEQQLEELAVKSDQYYTVAYKTEAIKEVLSRNYLPTLVTNYIEEKAGDQIAVGSYKFLDDGGFEVNVKAENFHAGLQFWDSLLQDQDIVEDLSLNQFTRQSSEEGGSSGVVYNLKGRLDLEQLTLLADSDEPQ